MYQKIMVPLDGSELAECVLSHVEAIAKGCGVPDITFVRVFEPVGFPIGSVLSPSLAENLGQAEAENKDMAEEYLNTLVSRLDLGGSGIRTEVITGQAAESLAFYAETNNIDLIIMATHGRSGIGRWVMGSVADRVLRSARIPVLMVRAPGSVSGG